MSLDLYVSSKLSLFTQHLAMSKAKVWSPFLYTFSKGSSFGVPPKLKRKEYIPILILNPQLFLLPQTLHFNDTSKFYLLRFKG